MSLTGMRPRQQVERKAISRASEAFFLSLSRPRGGGGKMCTRRAPVGPPSVPVTCSVRPKAPAGYCRADQGLARPLSTDLPATAPHVPCRTACAQLSCHPTRLATRLMLRGRGLCRTPPARCSVATLAQDSLSCSSANIALSRQVLPGTGFRGSGSAPPCERVPGSGF